MNKKLTNYVNGLFSDYPKTKKADPCDLPYELSRADYVAR